MEVLDLGVRDYREAWDIQKQLVDRRVRDEAPDTLIFVEHPPVYTLGRAWHGGKGGNPQDALMVPGLGDVPVIEIERGGKITFHGPGQLVGYPIARIPKHDLRAFLRNIELALVAAIGEVTGLSAASEPSGLMVQPGQLFTGVWIGNKKVASIGIAVRHWVSFHGFALNVSTDLRYFQAVNPCGFSGDVMTTLEKEMRGAGQHPVLTQESSPVTGLRHGTTTTPVTGLDLMAQMKSSVAQKFSEMLSGR